MAKRAPKTVTPPATSTLKGVEIFRAGSYEFEQDDGTTISRTFTGADIRKLADNFAELNANQKLWSVPLVLGHDKRNMILRAMGLPNAGVAARVWADGDVLFADFAAVPAPVAALINAGNYNAVSVEIADNFSADGKDFGLALRRVGLLGEELPKVKGMAPLPLAELAASDAVRWGPCVRFYFSASAPGESKMSREELLSQLEAAGADMSAVSDAVPDAFLAQLLAAMQAAKKPDAEPAVEASEAVKPASTESKQPTAITVKFADQPEYKSLLQRVEAAEVRAEAALKANREALAAARRADVIEFCEEQVRAGKLLRRDIDDKSALSLVKHLCGMSDADYAKAKDEIIARPKQYNFSDLVPDGTATTSEADYKAAMTATPGRRAVAERVEAARKAGLIR